MVESLVRPQLTGYLYDAEGRRVAKGNLATFSCDLSQNGFVATNQYLLGQSGEQVTELALQDVNQGDTSNPSLGMVWLHSNVYAAGALMASYDTGGLHFLLNDWLGTRRVQTGFDGVVEQQCQSLPFGDGETCQPTPTEHLFTGKERDAETGGGNPANGNDYFGARYYASSMGRFLSPDWAAKATPVPYAKLDNPQSLNLYSYVLNNPLYRMDPDGHIDCTGSGAGGAGCQAIASWNDAHGIAYDPANAGFGAPRQQQSTTSVSEAQNEQHQYNLVVERTNSFLNGATDQNGDVLDARDHLDSTCHLAGGNCAFNINHDPNDPTDAAFSSALNKALGENDGDTGAHGGLTPPTHRVGFSTSLHHDNDALHIDHFNGATFPIGTLLHAIVDVGIGSALYGTHRAFAYAGIQ